MKKIEMLLTNAFLPDPRPSKAAMVLMKAGYEVKILCWDRGENLPAHEKINGIEIERIRVRSKHGLGSLQVIFLGLLWIKMLCRLSREKFDIIYCNDLDTLPVGIIVKILKRKPLVFDSHDVYSKVLGDNVWHPIILFIEYLERTLIKRCDSVIVASHTVAPIYASYGAKRITVVENWKDPDLFSFSQETLDKEKAFLGIRDELVISFIANIGSERVIEPLLEVVRKDPSLFLIVAGDGCQRHLVEKASSETSNIKYLGHIPPEKVHLYTALSDIIYCGFDRNSKNASFCSPNKFFESLAAGKASLACNFGETKELIRQERCGIALDEFTQDKIAEALALLKDRKTLQAFKDNAKRAAVLKYNWANAEKELLKAFSGMEP